MSGLLFKRLLAALFLGLVGLSAIGQTLTFEGDTLTPVEAKRVQELASKLGGRDRSVTVARIRGAKGSESGAVLVFPSDGVTLLLSSDLGAVLAETDMTAGRRDRSCEDHAGDRCSTSAGIVPSDRPNSGDVLFRTPFGCGAFTWPAEKNWEQKLYPWRRIEVEKRRGERIPCDQSNIDYLKERASCAAEGGNWSPEGPFHYGRCTRFTADAGKACTDSEECEGRCVLEQTPPVPGKVVGRCSKVKSGASGCYSFLKKGEVVDICVN